jgi:hypothetical protein
MTVEYKIVNGKYVEGYFLTFEDIEKLIRSFQTSDPLDEKHMNIEKAIDEYLSHE